MPLQYAQVMAHLEQQRQQWAREEAQREQAREQALHALEKWSRTPPDELARRIEQHLPPGRSFRVAMPLEERELTSTVPCPPLPQRGWAWVAADGSQILPDRHRPFFYGLVNVAVFLLTHEHTARYVHTRVYLEHEFPPEVSPEAFVRAQRIQAEHQWLAHAAAHVRGTQHAALDAWPVLPQHRVMAMIDGPLELWGLVEREYRGWVQELTPIWQRFREMETPLVGYIDRPRANPVVTMLALLEEERLRSDVLDLHLFQDRVPPGHRTPVFALHTPGMKEYPQGLQVAFFYMNVGTQGRPLLVRVEIHHWVAQDPEQVARVHAAVWASVQLTGSVRYPYVLHRAHQEALVTFEEQRGLEELLHREWLAHSAVPRDLSEKQRLKAGDARRG